MYATIKAKHRGSACEIQASRVVELTPEVRTVGLVNLVLLVWPVKQGWHSHQVVLPIGRPLESGNGPVAVKHESDN